MCIAAMYKQKKVVASSEISISQNYQLNYFRNISDIIRGKKNNLGVTVNGKPKTLNTNCPERFFDK